MSAVFKKIIRDHKLSTRLNPVFTLAPELELACSRIAEFVGERFIGEEGPLIREMLQSGIDAFRRVRKTGEPNVAFMQGLFGRAHLLYARRYVARQGDRYHVWSPMLEPIPAFEARHAELTRRWSTSGVLSTLRSARRHSSLPRALTGEN
jgi:hypothetical protein